MKKPRTITIRVAVPKWARWAATDMDGTVYVYKKQPTYASNTAILLGTWMFAEGSEGHCEPLAATVPPHDWRKTLRRLK